MADRQGTDPFITGLFAGAVVGAIVAGLLAPRSGQETRALVRERGLELKDRAEDVVLRAQTVAHETLARVRQQYPNLPEGGLGGAASEMPTKL
jgi:gas vesicle protein